MVRLYEGEDEATRSTIDMNGDVVARVRIILIELLVKLLDVVVETRSCHTRDAHHADGILVAELYGILRA